MDNKKPNEPFVNAEALARAFCVGLRTVTGWRKQGCPCINTNPAGHKVSPRFSIAEVEAWLRGANNQKETNDEQ